MDCRTVFRRNTSRNQKRQVRTNRVLTLSMRASEASRATSIMPPSGAPP
ncbi:MAG: hypothetical protein OJF62_003438 [Pseudolabrys sp.]|nr:hypothetical protein [Pseudolabrys sp.]